MLQFNNTTPFVGMIMLLPDQNGVDTLYTVVKATFTVNGRLAVADEQVPVAVEEEYHGDPQSSSIRVPSDVGLAKPGTDVLLIGHAYTPRERPATEVDVSLAAGPVRKALRVIGDRVWRAGAGGAAMTSPKPFTRMPLRWERAFGGCDVTRGGVFAEARNPVGLGYRTRDSERPLDGLALPNLEDPTAPLRAWLDRPPPACLAPIAPHWEPRRSFAGTYDERWQQGRAPFLPADFDSRFLQLASPELVAREHLRGGEAVQVRGATPSGTLQFVLPKIRIQVTYLLDRTSEVRPAELDTLLIEPDRNRVIQVWRALLTCDKQALRIREVRAELALTA